MFGRLENALLKCVESLDLLLPAFLGEEVIHHELVVAVVLRDVDQG